nr:fatty acid desaturase [Burkholderia sp. Bp7605]
MHPDTRPHPGVDTSCRVVREPPYQMRQTCLVKEIALSVTSSLAARLKSSVDLKSRPSGIAFGLKLAVYATLIVHGAMFALSPHVVLKVLGVVLLGVMFAHGVELQHQALHYQGFRNKRFNIVSGVLLGLPMLVSFHAYQDSHLRHHRLLGTPDNKEFFDYGDQYGASPVVSAGRWLWRLSMAAHYLQFVKQIVKLFGPGARFNDNPLVSRAIRRDYLLMAAAIAILAGVSIALHDAFVVWAWLVPLVFVAAPVHALIEMPEHYRCDLTSTDAFVNTRTIVSNAFMTWLTNGNNYHVEHHLMPNLPIERLHDLHGAIAPHIRHYHATYREFYRALLRGTLAPRVIDDMPDNAHGSADSEAHDAPAADGAAAPAAAQSA